MTVRLTDRPALERARRRAIRSFGSFFLHETVRSEVEERLTEVNKAFTAPAVVTAYPQLWDASGTTVVPDASILDLEPGAHDLIVHALCLHWADDPVGQLIQARRALSEDGLLIAVLFGGQTLHEMRAALAEAEVATRGGLSPRILPMGEIRDLGALLQRAGFALPVADSQTLTVSYDSTRALVRDLRAMGETNALDARDKTPVSKDFLAAFDASYARIAGQEGGRITATFELIWLTGWAPGPGQQTPLRPGSAAHRLADALGTEEIGTGDPTPRQD